MGSISALKSLMNALWDATSMIYDRKVKISKYITLFDNTTTQQQVHIECE